MQRQDNRRILIVDDNAAIHADFKKILATSAADESALHAVEAALFDDAPAASSPSADAFEVASAYQGQEALERVEAARRSVVYITATGAVARIRNDQVCDHKIHTPPKCSLAKVWELANTKDDDPATIGFLHIDGKWFFDHDHSNIKKGSSVKSFPDCR